jgi:hypothetical protein
LSERLAVGTVVAGLLGVAACGDAFDGEGSCKETRTCPPPEQAHGGADPKGDSAAGEDAGGAGKSGGDSSRAGSDSSRAGSESGGSPAECSVPADCSNADASDGEESCVNGECVPGNPPPSVVAVTPANEAVSVEPDGSIVIELSEPLAAATVTPESVRLLDGDDPVAGTLSYADQEITFVPEKPLALLVPYEVSLSTAITDAAGAALAEPFSSTFKVRDGSWAVQTVVAGGVGDVSPTIQLTHEGDALVAWIGDKYGACPATAAWFNRGSQLGAVQTLNNGLDHYCRVVRSAVSRNGLALLSWYEEGTSGNNVATAEFRDGAWRGVSARSDRHDNGQAVAVAEDGRMHYVGSDDDVQVWQGTAAGVWSASGQVLSPRRSVEEPRLAIAASGDAVAVWRDEQSDARQSVFAARFSSDTAKWSSAAALPRSLVTVNDPEPTRGEPQVAFDDDAVPVIVWRRGAALVATHYDVTQGVWSAPVPISGEVTGLTELDDSPEPPALVFDGEGFVVAFTVLNGSAYDNYVVRYDRDDEVWHEPELVSTAAAPGSARMPRLTADAHGNLLLVWATAKSAGIYDLVGRRFDASTDTWSDATRIAGATLNNPAFARGVGSFALGGNASGLGALSFYDRDSSGNFTRLQLASFH